MSKKKIKPLSYDTSFIVWMSSEEALLCDRGVPLDYGCHVVVTEEGHAWAQGTLVTRRPKEAKNLDVDTGDPSYGVLDDLNPSIVVRVIGVYSALHSEGGLPPKGGPLCIHRARISGDGTPFPSLGPVRLLRPRKPAKVKHVARKSRKKPARTKAA